jgi:circadian clock protein KaiC
LTKQRLKPVTRALPKSPTGIDGLDEITGGGLPSGRPTLVCGGAGCGKTLFALQFLVNGAERYGEPGVFLAFEETAEELAANARSLGYDLERLERRKRVLVDHVRVERGEIDETGEYDLGGLFVRLGYAVDTLGAKRVVLDTLESLFSGFSNASILRAELRRLFRWLKDRRLTTVITGERGEGLLTRQGLEEYVSDCVILLDHRVDEQRSTRRLRVVKYRGTTHGTNEYPFLIDDDGISVMPITSLGLEHKAPRSRVSSGVLGLDEMLGGGGYYRGSTVLVSGTAGTGKTSLAAHFVASGCARGERCLYFAFEESPAQLQRNMRSIGLDLERPAEQGLLRFHATRATMYGLETHLATMLKEVREFDPQVVVVDPISSMLVAGKLAEAALLATRLVDYLKSRGVTCLYTSLVDLGSAAEAASEVGISSLIDTWLLVRDLEANGERNRGLYVLKSRGMPHSNQIREFLLTKRGIVLRDVYVGPEGVLAGSSRLSQEARERAAALAGRLEIDRQTRQLLRRQRTVEAQVEALRAEFAAEQEELERRIRESREREDALVTDREVMALSRGNHVPKGQRPASGRSRGRSEPTGASS